MIGSAEAAYSEKKLKSYRRLYPLLGMIGKPKDHTDKYSIAGSFDFWAFLKMPILNFGAIWPKRDKVFTSSAQKIFQKTTESLEIRLFGRSNDQSATLETAKIDKNSLPDGFSIIDTTSSPQNSDLWITLQRVKDIALGKLESIDLYAVLY